MSDKEKVSFGRTFLRSFLITLVIQIVGIILNSLYIGLLAAFPIIAPDIMNRFIFFEPFFVFWVFCIIAAAVNIVRALKSSLTLEKKALLIIFMPTNLCFFLFYATPLSELLIVLAALVFQ